MGTSGKEWARKVWGLVVVFLLVSSGCSFGGEDVIPGEWDGTYDMEWDGVPGTMTLVQTGTNIAGTYEYLDGSVTVYGTLTGTVDGDEFSGTWYETDNSGYEDDGIFSFTLLPGGDGFAGWYGFEDFPQVGDWTGVRQ